MKCNELFSTLESVAKEELERESLWDHVAAAVERVTVVSVSSSGSESDGESSLLELSR
jgi:hypothetical protein